MGRRYVVTRDMLILSMLSAVTRCIFRPNFIDIYILDRLRYRSIAVSRRPVGGWFSFSPHACLETAEPL